MKNFSATQPTSSSKRRLPLTGTLDLIDAGKQLFSYGYALDRIGDSEGADASYGNTIELLERIYAQANSGFSVFDLASLAFHHGVNLFQFGKFNQARVAFNRTTQLLESLIEDGVSAPVIEKLATTLGWLAVAQRKSDQAEAAELVYERAQQLWRMLVQVTSSPRKQNEYKRSLAATLLGASKNLKILGQHGKAEAYMKESTAILNGSLIYKNFSFKY